ncbi:AGE family epimerase/isomerase [Evansella sp. AB-P1]|uniref:AGE family epimerase/isomerase n=1 Tax=Evansella sp. AB-P1 TaxID=3037653 RepID=UPI00241CE82D|nr:AGE family epimerase/isomerase [Evansella sp. AB-P1]MDG5788005.1 AGE family epimerase/isomerase [Evansella sp. AB-P1]
MELKDLDKVKEEVEFELSEHILPFWKKHAVDEYSDGFHDYYFYDLSINKESEKACILHSRILWSFSAAYSRYLLDEDLVVAKRAYNYIKNYFWDNEFGGLLWSLDEDGMVLETRKHIYNQAFGINAMTEYYKATEDKDALEISKKLTKLIEKHSYDQVNGGYFEAFDQSWNKAEDLRLSNKDMSVPKTMTTHLHLLEAYWNLYQVWEDTELKEKIDRLFQVVVEKMFNEKSSHFILFFNEQWEPQSEVISYGHDMEGSWMLSQIAEGLDKKEYKEKVDSIVEKTVNVCISEALQEDGSLAYEGLNDRIIDYDRVWWVQAESIVAFLNAYQLTKNDDYLTYFHKTWNYIKDYFIDPTHGEWYWKLSKDNEVDKSMPIVEPWKGPYHNSRACMEVIDRITKLQQK